MKPADAIEKDNQILNENDIIQLCHEDQQQMAEHLINPPEAPIELKKLIRWREQQEKNA